MKKLFTFARSLVMTVSRPDYAEDVLAAKPRFNWRFFLMFNFLFAVYVTAVVLVPLYSFQPEPILDQVASLYPADLEVMVDREGVKVNQELPYIVPFPAELDEAMESEEKFPRNIVAFVSDEDLTTLSDVYDYDAFAVFTESAVYFLSDVDTREMRTYPLDTSEIEEPFVVGSAQIMALKREILEFPFIKYRWYIPMIGAIIWVAFFPLLLLVRIVTIFFYSAVLVVLFGWIFRSKGLGFQDLYRMGLHLHAAIVLLAVAIHYLSPYELSGLWYTAAYSIWLGVWVSRLPDKKDSAPKAKKTRSSR